THTTPHGHVEGYAQRFELRVHVRYTIGRHHFNDVRYASTGRNGSTRTLGRKAKHRTRAWRTLRTAKIEKAARVDANSVVLALLQGDRQYAGALVTPVGFV